MKTILKFLTRRYPLWHLLLCVFLAAVVVTLLGLK